MVLLRYKQKAGCVPVRRSSLKDGWDVLLVESLVTPGRWIFPKGGVEANETAVEAAARETCEEGGVIGHLGPKLGCWKYNRGTKRSIHSMWLLFVHTEHGPGCLQWTERHYRARQWYSFEDARRQFTRIPIHLRKPQLVEILSAAEGVISRLNSKHCIPRGIPLVEVDSANGEDEVLPF